MDCLKLLILLLFSIVLSSISKDVETDRQLLSKAKFLCPYTSFCDEPPLIETLLPEGKDSCCRNCSCKPDCERLNSCCFPYLETSVRDILPETNARGIRRECLYPAVSQRFVDLLKGSIGMFMTVVHVRDCLSDYIVVQQKNKDLLSSRSNVSSNVSCNCDNGTSDDCDTCKSKDTECGECYCDIIKKQENGIEILIIEKCICDNQIGWQNNCKCGDIKVAPWGSMLPVYSRKTQLLYKNPLCAVCDGVTDGIIWTPIIYCLNFINTFYGMAFEPENMKDCTMTFEKPNIIDDSLLPKCVLEDYPCNHQHFAIPNGLNMSTGQIIEACNSRLNSIYDNFIANVFCAICRDLYSRRETTCDGTSGIKASSDRITFLMTLDFVKEKTANPINPVPKNIQITCSSSVPSDCRELLCPTGKIRDAKGICTYPMTYTYIYGYSIALRLVPTKQEHLSRIAKKNVTLKHFSSPWPSNWKIGMISLERSRLTTSGVLQNETAYIVIMEITYPNKNQTLVLNKVDYLLKKKWVIKIDAMLVELRSEILEYKKIIFDKRSNRYIPGSLSTTKEFDIVPEWTIIYNNDITYGNLRKRNLIEVTKMLFCQQINLDPILDAYELLNYNRLLFLKNKHRYIFDSNFIYNLNGRREVRVCVENTDFVILTGSVRADTSINIIVTMCSFIFNHII